MSIAEFDFETYSEAGYIWDAKAKKWGGHSPTNKGISAVGAAVYSEHASTEVLSLAYDLRDGLGPRVWVPGLPEPLDLFDHIKRGGLIEAFNSAFEYFIWANVCEARMGWPRLPYLQLRDAKAKAMAHNLPGNLKGAAEAVGGADKIKDGKRLINLFSVPRTPTKKDPRQRIHPMDADQGEDAVKLYEYNMGDIIAERGVSERVPDLSAEELNLWLLDQKINLGGVSIDIDSVNNCIAIVDQAVAKYERDIPSITGGQVEKASQASAIRDWVNSHGYSMPDCTADSVDAMLERDLPEPIRRVLWTRSMLGSASVKKLYALKRQTCRDGRLRDIFAYYGAATGRWAGRGPQPQNLPNSGPRVVKCDCCQSYFSREASAKLIACLHGCPGTHGPAEWGVEAVESTLAKASYGDLEKFEQYYSDPIAAIGGCLRGLFIASEGRDFICSDYSAIEAVCLAAEAGEEWRLEVFRTHGLIYEMSAAKITGVPFEDFIKHKAETGDHHPLRKKVGKVAELACFSPDTQVLTKGGYVRIMDITNNHYLWDGTQWTKSDGAIYKGKRETIIVDGVRVTPSHPVSLGHSWREASELVSNPSTLQQALAIGSENIPSLEPQNTKGRTELSLNAHVVARKNSPQTQTCIGVSLPGALNVAVRKAAILTSKSISNTPRLCPALQTVGGYATVLAPLSADATMKRTPLTKTTERGEYRYAMTGAAQSGVFSFTCKLCPDGIMQPLKWTALIQTAIMSPVISGLYQKLKTALISAPLSKCKNGLTNSNDVYDIANAGPLHRFTIKTDSGHLIVHNSGYQGGLNAWLQFGADEHLEDWEIKEAVQAWRKESPAITAFWYGLQDAAHAAVMSPGQCFSYRRISYGVKDDVLYCQLPSGRKLAYHKPRLTPETLPWGKEVMKLSYMGNNSDYKRGPKGWLRIDTYGGRLVENVVQAVARDILAHALVNLDAAGYDVVLHVHDEIVAEVDAGAGSVEQFEQIMAIMPHWASHYPIKAAGGWRGKRYRKD